MTDTTIIIFGTAVFFLLAAAIALFLLIFQRRHLKEKYLRQKLEIELQGRVIKAIIDTQEIERKRMALDLHDDIGTDIMALMLANDKLLDSHSPGDRKRLADENYTLITSIGEKVRNVSQNLIPPELRLGQFEAAAKKLCTLVQKRSGLQIRLKVNADSEKIPLNVQVSLYRVLNEWLTNITKHAHASEVEVLFWKNANNYHMIVQDDGKGFDYKRSLGNSGGLGLMSMRGRLLQIGARFHFNRNEPRGTSFEVEYPIISEQS